MKQINKFIIVLLIMVEVISCIIPAQEPPVPTIIIKFQQPEYSQYVLVEITKDYTGIEPTYHATIEPADYANNPPYVPLGKDYFLISYQYRSKLCPFSAGLLTTRWSEYDGHTSTWPMDSVFIRDPIVETRAIFDEDIKKYDTRAGAYLELYLWTRNDNERKWVVDSVNTICQRALSKMIEDGTFEENTSPTNYY